MLSRNVVTSMTTRKLRKLRMKQRKPFSQPGLVYPCSTVPDQGQEGSTKKKTKEAAKKALAKAQRSQGS
jgi:hypothetical protein